MKKRPNLETYKELRGGERFPLMLQAQDRGDEAEQEHLLATCPRVQAAYLEPEPEFHRTAEAAWALARALATAAGPTIGWLSLLEELKEPCRRAVNVLVDAPEDALAGRFPFTFMQAAHDQALQVMKAMLGGFRTVCAQVALDPEVALRTLAPHVVQALAPHSSELEEAPTDPGLLAWCTEELRAVWDHHYWGATGERPPKRSLEQRRGA